MPEWPKIPVLPKDKSMIRLIYKPTQSGYFKKSILVFYNGKDSPALLRISGIVKK
ncbi:MAG: DUF1573 domain-containing protein [bacterium]